jgi:drug/metabolite transporter (DMT)-like permease
VRGSSRVWLAFILLCLIWGSSYLFIRVGLRQLTPLSLVALRLVAGAAAIAVIARLLGARLKIERPVMARLVLIATINTVVPFLLIAWGEVSVPSGLASVLNSTVPIFTVLLAASVLHDEPLSVPKAGGVAIGFAGVIVLLGRDLAQGGIHWSGLASQGAIVLASLCYAVGAVTVRLTLRGTPSMTIATWAIWISALETVALTLIFSRPAILDLNGLTVLSVLWLGVLGSALAYSLAYFVLENWGAGRYTMVAYTLPAVGLTLGAIFLGETLDWRILAGSALVVVGIVLASVRVQSRRSSASSAQLSWQRRR